MKYFHAFNISFWIHVRMLSHFVLPSITAPPYIISCVCTYYTLIPIYKTLDDICLYVRVFLIGDTEKNSFEAWFYKWTAVEHARRRMHIFILYLGTQGKIATQLSQQWECGSKAHTRLLVCYFIKSLSLLKLQVQKSKQVPFHPN